MDRETRIAIGVVIGVVVGITKGILLYMDENEEEEPVAGMYQADPPDYNALARDGARSAIDDVMSRRPPVYTPRPIEIPTVQFTPNTQLPRTNLPTRHHTPPAAQPTHRGTPPARQTPTRQTTPPRTDAPTSPTRPVFPTDDPTQAEPGPGPMELVHSPMPEDVAFEGYERWRPSDGSYDAFLAEPTDVGGFGVRASTEFVFAGQSARRAGWRATTGPRGLGLDLRIDPLRANDLGLTSPVIEDGEARQVFRLGRQNVRTRGGADVSYRDVNGLLLWRIVLPPAEEDDLATCYYAAIVGEQMVVLTARYDKGKPEHLAGFDAMAQTLTFTP